MAEKTTTRLGLPYPTSNPGKVNLGATNFEELAKRVDEVVATLAEAEAIRKKILTGTIRAASYTAVAGEVGYQTTSGTTTTLPSAPAKDDVVGLSCGNGSCKLFAPSGFIYGDFVTIASKTTTLTLTEGQHIVVQYDGTHWAIVSGESKRQQTYSPLVSRAAETDFIPNPSRSTFVSVRIGNPKAWEVEVSVGGVVIAEPFGTANTVGSTVSFIVPPGAAWRWKGTAESNVESSYLEL